MYSCINYSCINYSCTIDTAVGVATIILISTVCDSRVHALLVAKACAKQRASTADQKWHFHFPQCPAQSTAISQLQRYRSGRDHDYKSQFPTVRFSMPLVWRRRRERETSYMLGLTAVFAPSPLDGGACGARRPPRVGWDCGSTRAPPQGVAWAGLWRGGERWRGERVGGRGGGAVWGGVHPLRAAAQTRADPPWRPFPRLLMSTLGKGRHGGFLLAPSREPVGWPPLSQTTSTRRRCHPAI